MKSKTFVEPRWLAAIFFGLILVLGGFAVGFFGIAGIIMHYAKDGLIVILVGVFMVALSICSLLLYVLFILPKAFSLLTVSSEKLVWRCPFYRTVKMSIADCEYVTIEDMEYHNRAMPVIRGDEIAYIYLSNQPFPDKYKHKADVIRRKKGTIIFAYSDKLCQKLISILPENKTKYLISFYNRMQANDRMMKRKKRKK